MMWWAMTKSVGLEQKVPGEIPGEMENGMDKSIVWKKKK
jgi:hypothetical protein